MLDRVVMNIVDMTMQVGVVMNRVLPVASLPDAAFAFDRSASFHDFGVSDRMREPAFEHPPSCWIVIIACG